MDPLLHLMKMRRDDIPIVAEADMGAVVIGMIWTLKKSQKALLMTIQMSRANHRRIESVEIN